jgi:hypothetical protein
MVVKLAILAVSVKLAIFSPPSSENHYRNSENHFPASPHLVASPSAEADIAVRLRNVPVVRRMVWASNETQ